MKIDNVSCRFWTNAIFDDVKHQSAREIIKNYQSSLFPKAAPAQLCAPTHYITDLSEAQP